MQEDEPQPRVLARLPCELPSCKETPTGPFNPIHKLISQQDNASSTRQAADAPVCVLPTVLLRRMHGAGACAQPPPVTKQQESAPCSDDRGQPVELQGGCTSTYIGHATPPGRCLGGRVDARAL